MTRNDNGICKAGDLVNSTGMGKGKLSFKKERMGGSHIGDST